ncbi:putative lipoprotein [compost metagenome]
MVGTGNRTTVGTGDQAIGGLAFDGGRLIFDTTLPNATLSNSTITTAGGLDLTGAGSVAINLPAGGLPLVYPPAPGTANLLDQQLLPGGVTVQLVKSL